MSSTNHERFTLPQPRPDQQYVSVSVLTGGFITLSDHFFVHPATPGAKRTVPSLSFLITHPQSPNAPFGTSSSAGKPFRMLFDLGLRSQLDRYAPVMQKHLQGRQPFKLQPSVAEQLKTGGLETSDIDAVMLSHVHYDHHGDPEDFPASTFVVGHGALDVLENGLTGKGSHQHFEADLFSKNKTYELPPPPTTSSSSFPSCSSLSSSASSSTNKEAETPATWKPLGPFPHTLDIFSDSSVYIIDTPGHLPGHLNLLCRLSPDQWICLCGDAFHDPRLLSGEKDVGTWEGEDGQTFCIHLDKEGAEESIRRLRVLQESGVELVAAHDERWFEKARDRGVVFPGWIK